MSQPPDVLWLGLGRHGNVARERFLLPQAWCLHLFRDPMQLRVGAENFEIRPGCATIIPPNTAIEFHFSRPISHLHAFAHFWPRGEEMVSFSAFCAPGEAFEPLFSALSEAISISQTQPARAQSRLWDVLWRLSSLSAPRAPRDVLVEGACELIELRLSEPLSVSALARELGVSHNHLTRRFQSVLEKSVVGHIQQRRVARAIYLLRHSTLPIKAIANQCGLGDYHSFNKTLRRVTNRSPRDWRAE